MTTSSAVMLTVMFVSVFSPAPLVLWAQWLDAKDSGSE